MSTLDKIKAKIVLIRARLLTDLEELQKSRQ